MSKKRKQSKKKMKGIKNLKAKLIMFCLIVITLYLVDINGGWQKTMTRTSYDFDTNIVGMFR